MREEHAILDGITLPFDDKFWDEFFPPNGWNCRCNVVQVNKDRYEATNESEAIARGRAATYKPNADGVNKAAIFRFNPGKEQRIFPNKHPYFPKGCGDCGLQQYAIGKGNATCKACVLLQKMKRKEITSNISTFIKKQPKIEYTNNAFNGKTAYVWTSALIGEINTHMKQINKLVKTYDILNHLDRYLDENAELIKEDNYHNTLSKKSPTLEIQVLQSKYKGDLACRKNETIQLVFVKKQERGKEFWRLNFVRSWKSDKEYEQWAMNKKRQRK